MTATINHGQNVRRFRELLDMKQDQLADKLGIGWSQKKISLLESKSEIGDPILVEVSKALGIPMEAIKNFDTNQAIHNINNNFHDHSVQNQFNAVKELTTFFEKTIKEKDDCIRELIAKLPSK